VDDAVPELREPVMVAAFEGWNDAGEAASGALLHLEQVWGAQRFAELDPEDYHDFQVSRPMVHLDGDGRRQITWPSTRLSWASPPGARHDVVLVKGIEPSMRWRSYCTEILHHAGRLQVHSLITLGALLADVPHTRPMPVSSTSDDTALMERLQIEPSRYEGPTGIVGVLQEAAARTGMPGLSLWAAVPHYVGPAPSPKATLALLRRLEDLMDISVPLGEIPEDALAWERGVDKLAEEDGEIAEYVRQLEEAKDTTELPEATGEAIAREFERYLRRRDNRPGAG
jgi:proteasome assembly chaperone (PAC2) family protein